MTNTAQLTLAVLLSSQLFTYSALTSLRGETDCEWGAADCNPCFDNVERQLDGLENNYMNAGRIRFDGYAYPTTDYILHRISATTIFGAKFEHVQSIGRLAGIGNGEYMVFTHSTDSGQTGKMGALAVVRMGAKQTTNGGPFGGMPNGDGPNQNTSNRTVARTYTGNNHPGGLCVLGKYVYVAQWCQPQGNTSNWCNEAYVGAHGFGFSVYDVSRVQANSPINNSPPIHCSYRHVYGEDWIGEMSTSSVAAAKLSDGQYLVALGRSGGEEFGFYTAPSPIGPFTLNNSYDNEKSGENSYIVTECRTGELYMFLMDGSDDVDQVHLFRLVLNRGNVELRYVKSRTFICRGAEVDGAGDWAHFDAGAGMYITPEGRLILYATEWQQSSHGNIRVLEFP